MVEQRQQASGRRTANGRNASELGRSEDALKGIPDSSAQWYPNAWSEWNKDTKDWHSKRPWPQQEAELPTAGGSHWKRREPPADEERAQSVSTHQGQVSTGAASPAEFTEAQVTEVQDTTSEEESSTTGRANVFFGNKWSSRGTFKGHVPNIPPPREQLAPPGLPTPRAPPPIVPVQGSTQESCAALQHSIIRRGGIPNGNAHSAAYSQYLT